MRSCVVLALLACNEPPACKQLCTAASLSRLDVLAGQPGGAGWVDGVGAVAHFVGPWSFAGDGQGHLYLADGNMIRAIDLASASVTTLAGSYFDIAGNDGPGVQASFDSPSGLVWTMGALYLTDTDNHTLRKLDLASGIVSTVAGALGEPGSTDAVGGDARFNEPEGLALDGAGDLFIADVDNNTIRKLVLATGAVTTVAGTAGLAGTADGVGSAALFYHPRAMTWDGQGNLYVADSNNLSLRKLEIATATVSTLITFTAVPQGVTSDGAGVLVALSDNTIVRVAPDGTATPFAGGTQGFVDGTGSAAQFAAPAGLLNDGGTVYVADNLNYAIRTIALASGAVSTLAGAKSAGSADGQGNDARFSHPAGMISGGTSLWVADYLNHTIRAVELATGNVSTPLGSAGQPGNQDGSGSAARFNSPLDVALDPETRLLYVADSGNRAIRRVDLGTQAVTTLALVPAGGFTHFNVPYGIALDGAKLYVSDFGDHDVVAIDLMTLEARRLAGKAASSGTSDGVGEAARFYGPAGLRADGLGHLYLADEENHAIRVIDDITGAVTTLAGLPGTRGSSDGVGSAARFALPSSLAAGAMRLFVADASNNLVRRIDLASGAVTTVIGDTVPGVQLGPLPARLTEPLAVALTGAGGLTIASENSVLLAH